jgi:[acyl-carrier-protein] S-malonyltransferase
MQMTAVAIVFPGQGSQRWGMAGDFVERYPESRRVFDEASSVLDLDVRAICMDHDPRLELTEFTQPCILTAEIAMLEALRARFDLQAEYYGGHSLGEYTALVAAGVLPFDAALRLVRLRGRLMQSAVPVGAGGMVAVIQPNLDVDLIAKLACHHDVEVANFNSPSQVVLAGATAPLCEAADAVAQAIGPHGGRVVELDVSVPFHSRALQKIEPEFSRALAEQQERMCAPCAARVTSNFLGGFHDGSPAGLVEALTRQISSPVRWIENMKAIADKAETIIEVGPNRPLSRFFKEIGRDVRVVLDVRGAEKLFAVGQA